MTHTNFKIIVLSIVLILLGTLSLSKMAQAADSTKLTTGVFYANGQSDTINSDDVTSISIPLLLSVKKDKLSFGVSMSYLSVESGSINEQGLGDTTLAMGYDLTNNFTVKLKEKLPTGDKNRSLSTGKNDTSVQLDYFTVANQNVSYFGSVGYKFVGKTTGLNMQDSAYASIGTGRVYGDKTSIGVSLDYRESVFKNLDDQLGIAAFISRPLNDTYSLSGFAGFDTTQTNSIGVSLTSKF